MASGCNGTVTSLLDTSGETAKQTILSQCPQSCKYLDSELISSLTQLYTKVELIVKDLTRNEALGTAAPAFDSPRSGPRSKPAKYERM